MRADVVSLLWVGLANRRLQVRWERDSGRWFAFVLVACGLVCASTAGNQPAGVTRRLLHSVLNSDEPVNLSDSLKRLR
jgi:hypothetical protein